MSKEKEICPSCQQIFKLCECTFEEQMEAFKQEDMRDYSETVKRKVNAMAAKTYELRQTKNTNRYKTN